MEPPTKAQISARRRWKRTSMKKRRELGKKHSASAKEWWAAQTDEMKTAHGRHAAIEGWKKIKGVKHAL